MSKKGLGVSMAFFGLGSLLLPFVGLQFKLMNWAGSGFLATTLIVVGIAMLFTGE